MRRGIALVGMLSGCGAGQEVLPADAGVEASVEASVDTGAASGIPRCGPGPWFIHDEVLYRGFGDRSPLVGLPVLLDACSGLEALTDRDGRFKIAFTQGRPYDLRFGLPGLPPIWVGRYSGIVGYSGTSSFAEPPAGPSRDVNAPAFRLAAYVDSGRPAPCNRAVGIRPWVREVPDAKVHYFRADAETADPDDPLIVDVVIDALPVDADLTVEVDKPGCTTVVSPSVQYLRTSRTHADAPTQVEVLIGEPRAVDAGGDS